MLDKFVMFDKTNNLKCEILFNPEKPTGLTSMFKSNPTPADYLDGIITDKLDMDWVNERKGKVPRLANRLCGYWTDFVMFKGEKTW